MRLWSGWLGRGVDPDPGLFTGRNFFLRLLPILVKNGGQVVRGGVQVGRSVSTVLAFRNTVNHAGDVGTR